MKFFKDLQYNFSLFLQKRELNSRLQKGGELDLSNKKIQRENLPEFFKLLKENTTVTSLNLDFYDLSDKDFKSLILSLKGNNTLKKLSICGNGNTIDDTAIRALAELLETNPALVEINLNGNEISDAGLKIIAGSLVKNKNLIHLKLGSSAASRKSVEIIDEFARVLENNNKLLSLELGQPIVNYEPSEISQSTFAIYNPFAFNFYNKISPLLNRNQAKVDAKIIEKEQASVLGPAPLRAIISEYAGPLPEKEPEKTRTTTRGALTQTETLPTVQIGQDGSYFQTGIGMQGEVRATGMAAKISFAFSSFGAALKKIIAPVVNFFKGIFKSIQSKIASLRKKSSNKESPKTSIALDKIDEQVHDPVAKEMIRKTQADFPDKQVTVTKSDKSTGWSVQGPIYTSNPDRSRPRRS